MAKIIINTFTTVLVLALAIEIATQVIMARPAPPPADPSFIKRCSHKLGKTCAGQVFGNVFLNLTSITPECCHSLVYSLGWDCHREWVQFIITRPSFHGNSSAAVTKSVQVWDNCVNVAGPAPAPKSSL